MKYLYIFLLMPFLGMAQICPEDIDYPSPNVMPNEPGLDWRVYQNPDGTYVPFANGNVWISQTVGPPINGCCYPNPFVEFNNSNVSGLAEMPYDYSPEDGWVLISKRLGDPSGTSPNQVTHPIYVTYNRYTSTLRVLVLVTEREDDYSTKAVVFLRWDQSAGSNDIGSATLSHMESPMSALNSFNSTNTPQEFIRPNQFGSNDAFYWMYADFPIAYDPCVCTRSSKLQVGVQLIDVGEIKFEIDQAPQGSPPISGNSNNPSSSFFNNAIGLIDGGAKKGTERKKTLEGAITLAETVGSIFWTPDPEKKWVIDFETGQETVKEVENKADFKLPKWTKNVPKVGYILGFAEFLITGGNKSAASSPTTFQIPKLVADGEINFLSNFGEMIFLTPGAQQGGSSSEQVPEYNNPMGIFNLLELPKVEYLEYNPNTNITPDVAGTYGILQLPKIRHYKLAEDIKYILNPSSGLELVDIKGTFLFDLDNGSNNVPSVAPSGITPLLNSDGSVLNGAISAGGGYKNYGPYGPVLLGSTSLDLTVTDNYEAQLNEYGLEIDFWKDQENLNINDIRYKTKDLPIGALTDAGFLVYKYDNITEGSVTYNDFSNEPNVLLKLTLVLKRTDDPDAKEIVYITTYKTNIVEGSASPSSIIPIYNPHSTNSPFNRIDPMSSVLRFRTDYTIQPNPDGWIWKNIFLDYPRVSNIVGTGLNTVTINGTPTTIANNFNNIFFAWEQLNLTGNFAFNFDVDFRAQDEINDNSNSGIFSSSSSNITLKLDAFPSEADRQVAPVSEIDLNTFCADDIKYNPTFSLGSEELPENEDQVTRTKLDAYPNPFNTGFNVDYELSKGGEVQFKLFNSLGVLVSSAEDYIPYEGKYTQYIDAANLPPGAYIITLESPSGMSTTKIMKQNF
ncbi:MAG: T9SS type A sorting domain-containing protein [Saprospiraceae bacterium]